MDTRKLAKNAGTAVAVTAGIAAAGYGALVVLNRLKYGDPGTPGPGVKNSLLDWYLPEPEVPLITRMVRPAAESVEASVMDANLSAGAGRRAFLHIPRTRGTPIDCSVNAVLKRENDVYGAIDGT